MTRQTLLCPRLRDAPSRLVPSLALPKPALRSASEPGCLTKALIDSELEDCAFNLANFTDLFRAVLLRPTCFLHLFTLNLGCYSGSSLTGSKKVGGVIAI